jgi:hypothetical protein
MPNKQRDAVFYSKEAKNFSKKTYKNPAVFTATTHISKTKRGKGIKKCYIDLIFLFVLNRVKTVRLQHATSNASSQTLSTNLK